VPFIDHSHQHIFNKNDGFGGVEPELEKWNFSGSCDIQAIGRYRFYHDTDSNASVRFGMKLPTGDIHNSNAEENAERSLQPGTGSLDSIVGANAEPADSGSNTLSLSPGLSYRITGNTHVYGFIQTPITNM